MKILVIGGMHGNEPLGLQVCQLFTENPVVGIKTIIANEEATDANSRFIGQDLNRSFPGLIGSQKYENKRADELLKITQGYDIVLDFHNTYCPENDCGFMGETAGKLINDAAWLLGLSRIIVADYDCINKYASNCLSVEISMDSPLNSPLIWYERIMMLARLSKFTVKPKIEKYRFVYRITLDDSDRYGLRDKRLKAFQPIADELAKGFGIKSIACPIFIEDKFTPYNFGGLVSPIK